MSYARRPAVATAIGTAVMSSMSLSYYFDRIAIALSAVCILHCLAVPVLIAVLPIASVSLGDDSHFHEWMLWVVVPTSLFALGIGMRCHDRYWIPAAGGAGLALVIAAAVIAHGVWPWWQELVLSVIGSVILGVAHWRNFIQVRRPHVHK